MRNLKRVLALALALVMVIGMMVMGTSAASYTDAESITADYVEAIDVMSGVGMFEGTDGEFNPDEVLTRAQAAALLARLNLGKATADKLVATQQIFTDVAASDWEAGEVEYCYTVGLIDGLGNGKFDPDGELTGIAFAKLLLVALGYDADAEGYVGKDWAANIAVDARNANLMVDDVLLAAPVTREVAAQMLFQALTTTMVDYTTAYDKATGAPVLVGPNKMANKVIDADETYNGKVDGYTQFAEYYFPGLTLVKGGHDGVWGRPVDHKWYYIYTWNVLHTVMCTPDVIYTEEVSECDVAKALGLRGNGLVVAETLNGVAANDADGYINAVFSGAQKIGAQGRLTEVYYLATGIEIVYIDTFLAEVGNVTTVKYDKNGHISAPAYLTLNIYTSANTTTPIVLEANANWSYAKGDMLLVNWDENGYVSYGTQYDYVEFVDYAEALVGAQTVLWYNVGQHTVNGTTYNDACKFYLNEAGYENINHTWYFDQYGNLIGAADIDTIYAYGVLSGLYWVNDGSNYGAGAAYGVITYMDGTTSGIVEIAAVNGLPTAYARDTVVGAVDIDGTDLINGDLAADVFYVSTYALDNAGLLLTDLYAIETLADGTLSLTAESKTVSTNKSTIKTGVSKVADLDTADSALYGDNNTQYLVYNPVTKSFSAVTGYENIADFTNIDFCYKLNPTNTFLKYVFIKASADAASASDFVFVTNTGANFKLGIFGGVQYITVSGVVRADGSADAIVVKGDAEGTTAATITALQNKLAVGKLFKVPTSNGVVTDVDTIVAVTDIAVQQSATSTIYAEYEGKPTDYTNNGVLVVGGKYYNVNSTTTIVTQAGKGTTADLTAAVVNGKNVYVVYNTNLNTTAIAIFVTDVVGTTAADQALASAKAAAITAMQTYVANIAANTGAFKDVTAADMADLLAELTADVNAAQTVAAVTAVNGVDTLHNAGLAIQASKNTIAAADLKIGTVAELKAFAAAVAGGNTFSGKTVVLTADLDLAGEAWTPIGTSAKTFSGTFDGLNHTVKNFTASGEEYTGLFGIVYSATIKNLNVENATIVSNHNAGAVVGHANGSMIENCSVKNVSVTLTPRWIGNAFDDGNNAGGVIGDAEGATTVKDCSAENVVIRAYRVAGGVVGVAYTANASVVNCTAKNVSITIDKLTNAYETTNTYHAGGVVGRLYTGNETVTGCVYVGEFIPTIIE